MERNCHLIDLHKVIMAVILTAIKNQKNLHTLLDKPYVGISYHVKNRRPAATIHFCSYVGSR